VPWSSRATWVRMSMPYLSSPTVRRCARAWPSSGPAEVDVFYRRVSQEGLAATLCEMS
jgi:hypothetical protein